MFAVNESPMSHEKELDSEICKKIQMELTLPIYLKVTSHDLE